MLILETNKSERYEFPVCAHNRQMFELNSLLCLWLHSQNRRPSEDGTYLVQGVMYKRGKSKTSSWKKRYFVLESFTLFYFENEQSFFVRSIVFTSLSFFPS